ncbi:MAG: cytochrome P450 [Pseudonocardiaceae bacterium]
MQKSADLDTGPPSARDGGGALLAWLRGMRAENPVWRGAYDGWHVFRYADVARVLADPRVFSSDTSRVIPAARKLSVGNLIATDPPRHQQLRRLVGAALRPKVVTGLAGRIAELTHELLDATGGTGGNGGTGELFRTRADKLLTLEVVDPNDPEFERKIDEATEELLAYLREHCADRRAHPQQDLISTLVTAEVEGPRLTDEEVVNFSFLLLLAGHVTTTALLGNIVLCVEEHPRVWDELRADRSLVEATIEEVLPHRHAAFGHGIHFCIGQLLARVEARVVVNVLLDRYTQIRVSPGSPVEFFPRGYLRAAQPPGGHPSSHRQRREQRKGFRARPQNVYRSSRMESRRPGSSPSTASRMR